MRRIGATQTDADGRVSGLSVGKKCDGEETRRWGGMEVVASGAEAYISMLLYISGGYCAMQSGRNRVF